MTRPRASLALVTDSSACLPAQVAEEFGVEVVPLHVCTQEDGGVTTARPSVDELTQAYLRAGKHADKVLALHLTAALSGTVDNAMLAAQQCAAQGVDVAVKDLGVVAGALGLAVLEAATAGDARRGVARAREVAARSTVLMVVEDVAALRRGGRIDRTTAMMGSALGMRPVLRCDGHGVSVVDIARGRVRARRRLWELAVLQASGARRPHAVRGMGQASGVAAQRGTAGQRSPGRPVRLVVHGDEQSVSALGDEGREACEAAGLEVASMLCTDVDPALAAHVGPGAVGVVIAPVVGTSGTM